MARPVDDILADLLALEEEALGASDAAAGAQGWDPADALLVGGAAPTAAAVTNAADAALLADCDALLADVDMLLSDTAPATASARPARTRPAQAAQAAATAAVLSECDALLADADLLLADIPDDHISPANAAAARPVVPAPAKLDALQQPQSAAEAPAAAAALSVTASASASATGVLKEPVGQPGPANLLSQPQVAAASLPAVPAGSGPAGSRPSSDAGAITATAARQHADVDDLLLSLLSPQADAVPPEVTPAVAASVTDQQQCPQPEQLQLEQEQLPGVLLQQQQEGLEGQRGYHPQLQQQEQQQQQQQQPDPISALLRHQEDLQQRHQHQQHQPLQQPANENQLVGAGSITSSSDDDFLGDMLHDMAEVLEVDDSSLGTQTTPDTQLAAAAGAAAASVSVSTKATSGPAGSAVLGSNSSHDQAQQQHLSVGSSRQQGLPSTAGISGAASSASGFEAMLWQPSLSSSGAAASSSNANELPPHEIALQQAWAQEEALVHGSLSNSPPTSPKAHAANDREDGDQQQQQQQHRRKRQRLAPLPRLQELLSDALADWNPAGRPDASGTAMIGGSVLLCLESLAGLFAAGAAAAGAASGVDWAQVLSGALAPHGQLQCVAASGQYLAVGAASGSALVLQLPVPGTQASGSGPQNPTHSTGSGHSPLPGGAAMWQLGAQSGSERGVLGFDPVCSLGFSVVGSPGDALWLAVGHVSGAVTVWELQKRGPKQIAGIAQHSSRLTFTTFMPGRSTSLLLTGDVRGRCCLHTFSASLLRTNVASRVLIAGEYGPLLSIAHLTPCSMRAAAVPGAAVTGGAGAGGAVEWPGAAAWKMLCEDGAWRVGEGVCCLATPTHTYIARVKPSSGDLIMLFSIPQPHPGTQQGAVPVAAWLPHNRQKSGASSRVSGDTLMPLAVLALGWGSRLVLFDVPLVGDQITAGEAAAVSVTASQAAAAAHQAKRTQAPAAVAAAAASRLWQQRSHAAVDSLTPEVAIAVAAQFPLSTCASWAGGQQQPQQQPLGVAAGAVGSQQQGGSAAAAQQDLQQPQLLMGPPEPLPILGVHWLDADACAVVCNQGYSSLLVVLGFSGGVGGGGDLGHKQQQQQQQQDGGGLSAPAALRVYEQVEWMDQPVDRGWGSAGSGAGGLSAWGADCGGSVVGSGARMYLLGQQGGLFCGRLMPWSERLKTLQDVRKYKLGLYFALRFYLTMKQQQQQGVESIPTAAHSRPQPRSKPSSSSGGPPGSTPRQSVGGFARSEGIGAEPQQLEQWILSLVLGHAAATLTESAASATVEAAVCAASANGELQLSEIHKFVPAAVMKAAEACVCACLLLSRTDVLFGRVFQLFAQQGAVPGALGALVETIELAVLSDLLQGLAPEVMQALVEHFARLNQPGRVEACVVHLPIMSLDLNQVINLCEGCGLYSALTHVYNQMNDFRKPLLDLLTNVAAAPSWQAAQAAGYKLLVYLRCCFRGMAFPPGTGSLPTDPPGVRDVIQATLLGSLLFLAKADLLREWQQAGGPAAAVAAAVLTGGQGQAGTGGPVLSALCDPHPALQLLLAVDVPATITVLAEATAGWDAVETDLRAAAGKPTTELESVLVATQVVVNALVTLLEAGRFQQWQAHKPAHTSTDGSSSRAQPGADVAMSYIIQLLAAGRVNAKPSFVIKLLQHLVSQATAAAAAAQTDQQHPAAVCTSPAAPAAAAEVTAPIEQQFMSIVQVVGVQAAAAAGGVGQQPGQPALSDDSCAFSAAQAKEVLQLAKRCNFLRAAATVHHMQQNYAAALSCYLALVEQQRSQHAQQQQQQQLAVTAAAGGVGSESAAQEGCRAVFGYIDSFLRGGGPSTDARAAFLTCVRQQVVQLIRLDAAATAAVLLQHMPDQQVPVLLSLAADPELQFQFLRAAMQQNQQAQEQQQRRQSGSGSGAGVTASTAAAAGVGSVGGVESLLERPEVALMYVKLLARFEPAAVLPFLQSHHNYSVAEAIKVCRVAGVHDAEAFLHERLGDLDAALHLYLSTAQRANSTLQAALLEGTVPLLLLPPGYWVPGWFDRRSVSSTGRAQSSAQATSSSREQPCWGMEHLVQQLDSVAQMVTVAQSSSSSSSSSSNNRQQQEGETAVPGDVKQASEQLLAAAANVAATLLHQLDPNCIISTSNSRRPGPGAVLAPAPTPTAAGDSPSDFNDAVEGTAAVAALQLPPPIIDLHKAWMAELSPRLRLKGLGVGVGVTAPAAAGPKHGLVGLTSCPGGSSTAGLMQAGLRIPVVPPELAAAWQAVQVAVAFCQRNTRPSGSIAGGSSGAGIAGSSSSSALVAAAAGQELWFQLMDVFVGSLRGLHTPQQQQQQQQQQHENKAQHHHQQQPHQQQQLVLDLRHAACQQVPLKELPSILRRGAAAVAYQQILPGLLRLLLDEVVGCMADHLPLLDIVGRIIRQHGSERFGEFRSTLLGLFGATGYDSAIMAAANRLITGDAFGAVRHAYGLRQLVRTIQEQQQEGDAAAATAVAAGSSSRMLVAAPSAAAAAAPAAAVQSAMLLGVLGPSSYDTDGSAVRISSRYSLTQADRNLIQGILGSGGMKLRLQPAGPVAGQLPGVTAAYRVAAQAVADTGRVFQGEMDLALELAMMQSMQEHQQHQRQQHHGAAGVKEGADAGRLSQEGSAGRAARARTSSFDIDELLNWSTANV